MKTSPLSSLLNKPSFHILSIAFGILSGCVIGFFIPLRISIPLRYDFFLPLVSIFLILWLSWRFPQPWREIVSAFITSLIFSASLSALWRTGIHEIYEVFGLIPWFDSRGYYSEALRLLDGGVFSQISARRPLFPGFFSVLLFFTGRNLRAAIVLISLLASLSTWLLAREINQSEKKAFIPAGITTLLFFYYRNFNGAVLTETLGYPLGLLGLALLWNAAVRRKAFTAFAGLFCLTVALTARPGAVLTLPLLIFWIAIYLKNGRNWPVLAGISVAVIAFGLIINSFMTSILAPENSSSYSNFAQTMYGLVNGGVGWQAIYVDHPEYFTSGNEGYASQQIYQAAWQIFKTHPEKTIQGGIRAIATFFSSGKYSAFNFLGGATTPNQPDLQNSPFDFLSRWSANFLFILIIPVAIFLKKSPKYSLLLALNLGVLFSLPFAPPWDAENMRAYAASIGGMAIAIVYILFFFTQKGPLNEPLSSQKPWAVYGLSGLLIILMTIGPLTIHMLELPPIIPSAQCPTGEVPLITQVSAGTSANIGILRGDPFSIPYSRFLDNLNQFPDAKLGRYLQNIPEGSSISQQNDLLKGGNAVLLVAPFNTIPKSDTATIFCGNWGSEPETGFIFYARHTLP